MTCRLSVAQLDSMADTLYYKVKESSANFRELVAKTRPVNQSCRRRESSQAHFFPAAIKGERGMTLSHRLCGGNGLRSRCVSRHSVAANCRSNRILPRAALRALQDPRVA